MLREISCSGQKLGRKLGSRSKASDAAFMCMHYATLQLLLGPYSRHYDCAFSRISSKFAGPFIISAKANTVQSKWCVAMKRSGGSMLCIKRSG